MLGGGHACKFFKLAHKVEFIVVTGHGGNCPDWLIGGGEIKLCQFNACLYDIVTTGNTKKIFV